jgi:crotonobetainyl-CoA:carnitine CoA-transferase CaiB-like acyl-CoA transferase
MQVRDPDVGTFGFARTPPHMSSAPELPAEPAPNLGQHTREILQDILGYDSKDIDKLASDGVVQVAEEQD